MNTGKMTEDGGQSRGDAETRRKLFVALPVYGGVDPFFTQCLIKLVTEPPCDITVRMNPGDSLVARARNSLTAEFLKSDCSHLLFIDTDLIFSTDHIKRLLDHEELVVGGLYPKKQEGDLAWVMNCLDSASDPRPDGLQEVKYIGTGFLRVSRLVFERMIIRSGPEICYTRDDTKELEYDFWGVGPYQYPDGSRRYLSEDWMFCQRVRDLGGQVWADRQVVLKHVGTAVYPLRTQFADPSLSGFASSFASPARQEGVTPPPPGASISDDRGRKTEDRDQRTEDGV